MVKLNKMGTKNRGLISFLSPLEMSLLSCLWKKDNLKVRHIHKMLGSKRDVPISSIAVTLDRLHKNKIVKRKIESGRGGMHYIYSSKLSKSDFEQQIVEKTVNSLITSFGQVAFSYFNDRFSNKKYEKPVAVANGFSHFNDRVSGKPEKEEGRND